MSQKEYARKIISDLAEKWIDVICFTKAQDREFRELVESFGIMWNAGERPSELTYWEDGTIMRFGFNFKCGDRNNITITCQKHSHRYVKELIKRGRAIPFKEFKAMVLKPRIFVISDENKQLKIAKMLAQTT